MATDNQEATVETAWPRAARVIVHADLDAFFAACHILRQPDLADAPLVVGGDPAGRGVVATASYVARRYGIHSAMPCAQARRLCPVALFVRPDRDLYRPYSRRVMEILRAEISPVHQQVSIDEAFIDATGQDDRVGRAWRGYARPLHTANCRCSRGLFHSP